MNNVRVACERVTLLGNLQFIGLKPDKLQVKHSRWSCEARYSA